jgi:hypothetical protein
MECKGAGIGLNGVTDETNELWDGGMEEVPLGSLKLRSRLHFRFLNCAVREQRFCSSSRPFATIRSLSSNLTSSEF